MLKNEELYYCRICGYKLDEAPWGTDGNTPLFDYCPCCGVEFGYQDSTLKGILNFRQQWIEHGATWYDKLEQPKDWSLEEQLKYIPDEWLK